MSSAYYEIYLKGVFDLASTMVVKSEDTALAINARLKALQYEVDESDPTTWKYYKHLSGQYHETDTPMTVESMDTGEVIAFTVDTLEEHRATRREFTYRSRFYKELVSRYPKQEQLILGILNPIDLDEAIAANDHTILYYDPLLVEATETPFIPKLQAWINAFFIRWDVPDYHLTDSLFTAAILAVFYAHLPKAILNIRLELARTDYAHTFHIHQYLSSFGRLDPYLEFLTHKQKLALYRNIRYINLNNGKQETFEWLTQKILTDRRFPLAEYNIRQNYAQQPETLYADIELERRSINGISSALGLDIKTVNEVLDLEQPLASGNYEVQAEAEDAITRAMRNSLSSELKTKVLESNVLDTTDAEPFTLTEVLLNHWIYLSNVGRYVAVVTTNNPGTGEPMRLSVKDAFTLYLYTYNKARGVTLERIPTFDAQRVRRMPLPTREELASLIQSKHTDPRFVDYALKNQPILGRYISIESFREACIDIHQAMLNHRNLYAYRQHYQAQGEVKQMVNRFYMNYPVSPDNNQDYSSWFAQRSLQIEQLTEMELDLLASNLYTLATGVDAKNSRSLQEIHQAMLDLQMQLSSYSIQLIQQINTGNLKIIDWPKIRPGTFIYRGRHQIEEAVPFVRPLTGLMTRGKSRAFFGLSPIEHFDSDIYTRRKVTYNLGLSISLKGKSGTGGYARLGLEPLLVIEDVVDLNQLSQDDEIDGYYPIQAQPLATIFNSLTGEGYTPLSAQEKSRLT